MYVYGVILSCYYRQWIFVHSLFAALFKLILVVYQDKSPILHVFLMVEIARQGDYTSFEVSCQVRLVHFVNTASYSMFPFIEEIFCK